MVAFQTHFTFYYVRYTSCADSRYTFKQFKLKTDKKKNTFFVLVAFSVELRRVGYPFLLFRTNNNRTVTTQLPRTARDHQPKRFALNADKCFARIKFVICSFFFLRRRLCRETSSLNCLAFKNLLFSTKTASICRTIFSVLHLVLFFFFFMQPS